jgi:predicted HicB family RNase H-like nuclease
MAERPRPKVTRSTPMGRDVNLDTETRRDKRGRRITGKYVDRVVEAARKPGRPALSGEGPSPAIAFRLPADLRRRAEAVAADEGKSVSELAREALEARLAASG